MKIVFGMILAVGVLFSVQPAFAENINEAYNGAPAEVVATSPNSSDTNTVDLSDTSDDQPVNSPSLENTTPAGQAPGQPLN